MSIKPPHFLSRALRGGFFRPQTALSPFMRLQGLRGDDEGVAVQPGHQLAAPVLHIGDPNVGRVP